MEVRRGAAASLRLVAEGLSDGWTARLPLTHLVVRPGQPMRLMATLAVPPQATTGDRQTLRIQVRSQTHDEAGMQATYRIEKLVDLVVA